MAQTDSPAADDRTEVRLLAEIAAGGEHAFVELYRRRHNDVYRFAFAMAKSRSFAQDVTQEVFLNVLENASRFDSGKGSVRAWLFGCARYVTLDRLRLERRWTDELPAEGARVGGDERLLADQRVERLHAAIARLPVEYREALVSVRAARVVVRGDGRRARMSARHRALALASRPRAARAMLDEGERAAADAGPRVATPLQAGEVCS